jgi:hypothetical protein
MNWYSWLLWGFAATIALTTLMAGSEGIGITRMNIPHMLGTMFTPNRDRAKVYGVVLHVLNGWAFSLVYVAGFHAAHLFNWWFGALLGFLHGAFVAAVALPVMPGVHPRMASALRGPTVARQLEPPGFLALNYGVRTPISVLAAHVVFGAILGALYTPSGGRGDRVPCVSAVQSFQSGAHHTRPSTPGGSIATSASMWQRRSLQAATSPSKRSNASSPLPRAGRGAIVWSAARLSIACMPCGVLAINTTPSNLTSRSSPAAL